MIEESESVALAVIEPELPPPSHHLVALSQEDLTGAHTEMLRWMRQRLAETRTELVEQQGNLTTAKARKWNPAPFQRLTQKLARQVTFYEKVEAALLAGFVLVPNFEMDVFAIRTTKRTPSGSANGRWSNFIQPSQLLVAGEGEYRNPWPTIAEEEWKDGKGENHVRQWADDFRDVSFPLAIARPELVNRAGEVLAMKLFDEVGLAVNTRRRGRGDPILLGHFRNPRPNVQGATFFLGWYFDPRSL